MRRPALLPLTAAVLTAHAWLLWQLPALSADPAADKPELQSFATRSIAPPAPPAPVRAKAVKKPAPPPRPAPPAQEAPIHDENHDFPAAANPPAQPDTVDSTQSDPAAPDPAAPETSAEEPAEPPAEKPAAPQPETLQGVQLAHAGGPAEAATELAVRLPAPARLSFEVTGQSKRFDYHASAALLWQHDGSHYQARQEIKAFLIGSRGQTSSGQIGPAGLVPEHFSDQGRGEKTADFDFAAQQARFSSQAPPAAIGAGAQDRLSVFLQLSALLAAAPQSYPPGTEITFTTVGSNDAERWTFRVQGLESLELPIGTLEALRLERLPRRAQDQQAALWLAPALDYLPVRIRLTQANGDFADLRLKSYAAP